jgi:aryl-alcohol dehydrogenase-like predicted oxidoreductase
MENSSSFSHWSRVGLGTGTLASLGRGTTQEQVNRLLSSMREMGVSVIDTADSYTSGRCETLLGEALMGRRDQFVVVTKAGYRYGDLPWPLQALNPFIKKAHQKLSGGQCHAPNYLTRSLERSLQRLQLDHVDAFLLHDPSLQVVTDPAVQASLSALKKAGKTLHLGVSSEKPDVLAAAIQASCFSVIQSPANPTTVRSLSEIWQQASRQGIHRMANHVFFSGNAKPADPSCTLLRHESLMRYVSARFGIGTILVGTRNPMHLQESVEWANSPLSMEECLSVEQAYLSL